MLKIGLTGGIGSGKTTAAQLFADLGIPIYLADSRAKDLQNSSPLKEEIASTFGADIYKGGILDRKQLASIVFQNKDLLQKLNALVHPAVAKDYDEWLSEQHAPYIIKEAAVIFEIGAEASYDFVILVTAQEETRIERVRKRDGSSHEEVLQRMRNQMSDEEKMAKADFAIRNEELSSLKKQVLALHQGFISPDSKDTK